MVVQYFILLCKLGSQLSMCGNPQALLKVIKAARHICASKNFDSGQLLSIMLLQQFTVYSVELFHKRVKGKIQKQNRKSEIAVNGSPSYTTKLVTLTVVVSTRRKKKFIEVNSQMLTSFVQIGSGRPLAGFLLSGTIFVIL